MDAEIVAWGERVRRCEDGQLMAELQQLVRRDRRCEVRMLMYLAEVDERRLFLEQGYSCLFRYATAVLRMSDQRAYLRIQAARLARTFPVTLELLAEGALTLSTLKMLGKHLTVDNHLALLERARGKTKDEVALLIAEIAPQDDLPGSMRKLPEASRRSRLDIAARDAQRGSLQPSASKASDTENMQNAAVGSDASVRPVEVSKQAPAPLALEGPRASSTPLRPGRFKLQLTASQALHDKLTQLQHLLRHQVPGGDLAQIVERACDVLLDKTLKQRFAQVSKPRLSASAASAVSADASETTQRGGAGKEVEGGVRATQMEKPSKFRSAARSRYIPRAVLREVFARDGGQCTFVSATGQRCSERGMLEVHHVRPFARGGEARVENLKVIGRSHNSYFAVEDFGAAHMRLAARKKQNDQGLLFAS